MIGALLGGPGLDVVGVDDRLYGSIAAALAAVERGAAIVRVHDVKPTVEALKVAVAVINIRKQQEY